MLKKVFGIIAIIPLFLSVYWFTDSLSIFSENTGLYFFSALLQANAAILSIVGVFYIFRIQSHQSSIGILESTLLADKRKYISQQEVIKFRSFDIHGKKNMIEEKKYGSEVTSQFSNWIDLEQRIVELKKYIKLPTILLSFSIAIFAFGLLTAYLVHSVSIFIEFGFLYICFLYELLCLYKVLDAIIKALNR